MQAVRKFLFDTSFDYDEGPAAPQAEREQEAPPEAFSRADLDAARRSAFEEGKAEGLREARAASEEKTAAALALIAERLEACAGTLDSTVNDLKRDATEFAVALVRKAMPGLARQRGLEEIEAAIRDCLEQVMSEPKVVVRVHDSLLDALKARIDGIAERSGYTGKVVLLADDRLDAADCRVEWADGGLEREGERLWSEIDRCIERFTAVLDGEGPRRTPSPLAADAPESPAPNPAPRPDAGPQATPAADTPNATTE